MSNKYCVHCEEKLSDERELVQHSDFCSQECADEYLSNADERVLLLSQESNPDALPIPDAESVRWQDAIKSPRTNTPTLNSTNRNSQGGVLPETIEAVQSLLRIGGVSKEAIDNVVNIDKNDTTPK